MHALGIDLGGSKIEAVLLSASGRELWRQRIATPAGDYDATLRAIAGLVALARDVAAGACSIGLGTPGSLTSAGLVKNANSVCLNGRPLQADLEAMLGQPVRVANDANCLALSEATDGAGAGAPVVFAAILGTGVGAGIAVHGRVLGGPNGLAAALVMLDTEALAGASAEELQAAGISEGQRRRLVAARRLGERLGAEVAAAADALKQSQALVDNLIEYARQRGESVAL